MVEITLTNKEWYFLHVQLEKIVGENPNNYISKSILEKLAINCPKLDDVKIQFAQEYECEWIGKNE